jgi:hypothetical protein
MCDISQFKILVGTATNALVEQNNNIRKFKRLHTSGNQEPKSTEREHSYGRDFHCD